LTAELPEGLPSGLATALLRLRAAAAMVADATAVAADVAEDHRDRVTGVRDRAMALAMVPVRQLLAGYPTLVRKLATAAGAEVDLILEGEDVELDKRVLDAVADALGHLVTNAVDHGCEPPARRLAAAKPERCTIVVSARNAGGTVVITVTDDGVGVDRAALRRVAETKNLLPPEGLADAALLDLLFHPGLSTRSTVGETSGRGVGLDVVRSSVTAIGGTVSVVSDPGVGTSFEVVLPVSLGVVHVLVARIGQETFAVPVTSVQATLSLKDVALQHLAGSPTIIHDGVALPVLDLGRAVGSTATGGTVGLIAPHPQGSLVWAVDALVGESDIVVRDLGGFLGLDGGVPGIAGATFDSDGAVLCLLDLREAADAMLATPAALTTRPPTDVEAPAEQTPARVLVVEDSIGVRELERAVLTAAGYAVTTCIDGLEAAERVRHDPFDLVLSDVEMPGMTGVELTRLIRSTSSWSTVPVVLMTSLGSDQDRRAGLAAGASAYLLKSAFAPEELIATVRRLVGR
jgi:chemotaxis protein histidine kinase CheA/CheY-like chemotaxis protein